MSDAPDPFARIREARLRRDQDNRRILDAMGPSGGGPDDPGLAGRVDRLEADMREATVLLRHLDTMMAGIAAQIAHLATKEEHERFRGETLAALAGKPGTGAMWGMAIALFALVMAAMAASAIYLPLLSWRLHAP